MNPPPGQFPPPIPQQHRQPGRLSTPIIVVIVLFALTVIGYGGYVLVAASKQTVDGAQLCANNFLTSMRSHDYKTAFDQMVPGAQQKTPLSSVSSLQQLVEKNHGAVQGWTMQRWFIQSYNGTTYVALTYNLNCAQTPTQAQITVEKQGTSYFIYEFQYQL